MSEPSNMDKGPVDNVAYHKDTASNGALRQPDANIANSSDISACALATSFQSLTTKDGNKMVSDGRQQEFLLEEECDTLTRYHDDKVKEHLLNAVRRGSYDVVVSLFDSLEIGTELLKGEHGGYDWNQGNFPPLIVAAQLGQYDIIKFFLSKGYRIEAPHEIQCGCENCRIDYLRTSQERLSLYKALANPIWITLTTDDPILTAFTMSTKMKNLANQEDEFENEYLDLYKSCKQLAVGLLSECYDSKEQETILNYSHEDNKQANNGEKRLDLLKMAISMEQKERHLPTRWRYFVKFYTTITLILIQVFPLFFKFVAHTFSQHLLMSLIYKCAKGWRNNNLTYKILFVTSRVIIFPFMAVAYIVLPCWSFSCTMKEPLIKFINHTTAFITFLMLLAISSTQSLKVRAGGVPGGIEFLIIFYVLGLMWSECKQLWSEGLFRYLSSGWNWMDLSMLLMLCGAFLIWTATAVIASFSDMNYNKSLQMTVSVADGLYATGIVMSFFRLIYLCQISRYLGLLQLCLSRMVRVIMQFAFISCVVLWSFSIGMHMLYNSSKHFPGKNRTIPSAASTAHSRRDEDGGFLELSWHGDYNSLMNSVVTMSWASFNMIELTSLSGFDNTNMIQFWSAALFTVYHTSTMIVLLNMLIAMMANSYQQIEDNIEIEYKFARAQMWVEFFDDVATLPAPFNIIPTPKTISRIFSLLIEKIFGKSWSISYHGKRSFSLHRAGTFNSSRRKKAYLELCEQLVKRYLARKELNDMKKDVDTGLLQAIESSKTEIKKTLEDMKQFIKIHKKT